MHEGLGAMHPDAPRLRGDLMVWLVVLAELATFGLMFIAYAVVRLRELPDFQAGQAALDLRSGTVNTALLLAGSWCVARGVHALRQGEGAVGTRWTLAALACGLGFLLSKSAEYSVRIAAGLDVEARHFDLFYVMLTGFHFLHVVAACVVLAVVAVRAARGAYTREGAWGAETAAVFWHLVDLLWLVLFPLLYVMR